MNNYSPAGAAAKTRIGIVGATGYAGVELVRLLARHPAVELVAAMSSSRQAKLSPLGTAVPALAGVADITCEPASVDHMLAAQPDVVFLATPPEASLEWAPALLSAGLRVIDLSGAFRFCDPEVFQSWYGIPHTSPHLLKRAVYGWPEKYRDQIRTAELVANPGCYATAANTALWPLITTGIAEPSRVICDAKSGASGAGKGLREDLHFVELQGNCKAYGVLTHRHTPEIAQHSGLAVEDLTFTPHLLPISRGILATSYATLTNGATAAELTALYRDTYSGSRFVRVLDSALPELNHVVNTNFCDLGVRVNQHSHQAVVVTCLDNLLKGAAGQAVQNLNCMIGVPEETALL
jgi:N-acetyl-gamma-glutamyl-phosphate reductase